MGMFPVIAKTVLSGVALLMLIVVLATDSLYGVKGEGDGSLGVFKESHSGAWDSIEDACSDIKTLHTIMKIGAIVGLLAVVVGVVAGLAGYFMKLSWMNTVGMIAEVIQIVGTATLVATIFILFYSKFDCSSGGFSVTVAFKDSFNVIYGAYLSCVALVLIFINLCVGLGTKNDSNDAYQGQNYSSYNGNTQEMANYHQTV